MSSFERRFSSRDGELPHKTSRNTRMFEKKYWIFARASFGFVLAMIAVPKPRTKKDNTIAINILKLSTARK